jgi:hypothetical protein
MYGMMIPMLFPIALLGLINMYVNERLLLAYYYKQPPMYDMELHLVALRRIKLAPILMYLLGYWAIGNRQLFDKELYPKEYYGTETDPGHSMFSPYWDATYVCLIYLVLSLLGQLITPKIASNFTCKFFKNWEEQDIDENLGQFWSNLSAFDQKLWYTNEVYQRNVLKIKTISDESLEILRTDTANKPNVIKGSPNYEILNNRFYAEKLQFQSLDLRYDNLDYENSDMICRTIYTNPHNQTEEVVDMMKTIADKMNTNLMIQKIKKETSDDFEDIMTKRFTEGRYHKQNNEFEMIERRRTTMTVLQMPKKIGSKDSFVKLPIN